MNDRFPREGQGSCEDPGSSESLDEQALRRLLQGAVGDLEPSPDALEHLRHAVPARRTRRRQVLVGAAAAVILGGTALPAFLHVAVIDGTSEERHANTASAHSAERGAEAGAPTGRGGSAFEGDQPRSSVPDRKEQREAERQQTPNGSVAPDNEIKPSGSPGGTLPDPTGTFAAISPTCVRDQLGRGTGSVGTADKEGRVYGAFRVVNVSHSICTVAGSGTVSATAHGSADPSRVSVVDHTPGDAATGLPDPTGDSGEVILQPGQAYEVKFAWIPSKEGCAKPSGGGSPAPGIAAATPSAAGPVPAAGPPPGVADPGGAPPPPPSVVLSHTPEGGEPTAAEAKIDDACAGTVYRTGPLATAS
ncbi:hypothetical protein [Streptomyces sp. UNOC14_S4]|uniref:hypothetical protein n=1 Tax=Streptomyces sp. UNOC14_S4 TaxID=2872340 RepID=UPI001E4CF0FD|nr:hypothetical protein [Streptomyces sp. UNOC14_S4]MCC3767019.1 hypothetical protein [Streptomyces sp. UNOC14_S4]